MKYIYLLGACGSIGTQTLDVIRKYSNDLKVIGLSVGHDSKLAKKIISEFKPEIVSFRTKEQMEELKSSDLFRATVTRGFLRFQNITSMIMNYLLMLWLAQRD